MAMLDDIKAAEVKAEALKESAAEQAKKYAAAVALRSASERKALISEAREEAERMSERAEREADVQSGELVQKGHGDDERLIAEARKNLSAAVKTVFGRLTD